jgi:dephospho-CoA kinase
MGGQGGAPTYGAGVLLTGLTGGIGSGKSTVADGLAELGAIVIDADLIAREIVLPGGPAYQPVIDRFGPGVVGPDAAIDRPALAAIVFSAPEARADLNRLTHPVVGAEILARVAAVGDAPRVVVLDIPLLVAATVVSYGLHAVVVVDTPEDVAVARLTSSRGFTEADARARISAQITREERRRLVDLVATGVIIDNSGDRAALDVAVKRVWGVLAPLAG